MLIAIVGIDLGKNSCSVAELDTGGAVVLRRRMSRAQLAEFVGGPLACVVAMDACSARITSGGCSRRRDIACG